MGRIVIIGIGLVLAGIGGIIGSRNGEKDKTSINSQSLTQDLNEDRRKQGKVELRPINGDTNTYARKDKSWKNAGDFFLQMLRGRKE